MSDPKLHHYVPQFHLRRFTDTSGNLWVWDRGRDRTFRARPGSIAAETQFYRLEDFAAAGHDPLTMEKQLSAIEAEVATITNQWLGWLPETAPGEAISIPLINREIVARFLGIQFLRTADTREILSAFAMLERDMPLSADDIQRLHLEFLWDLPIVESFTQRFVDGTWIFAVNSTGTPYLTSDNPIAFRTGDNRQWVKGGVQAPGVYLVYPMSPTVVLYIHPKEAPFDKLGRFADCRSPVAVNAGMVESDNSGQVFMASRFIFADRDAFDSARAFAPTIGTGLYADSAPHD